MDFELLVGLILLLPLAGAFFCGVLCLFFPALRRSEAFIGSLATLLVAIPFGITAYLFASFNGEPQVYTYYSWMAAGDLSIDFAYRIDQLSLIMMLIVTGVGALIHLYSIGYMHGDRGFWKFFSFLNLFIFMMLNLVMGDNLVVLFLGWEGVGLCSYLLIGFWYEDLRNSAAANKAFIVNRIGDFAFLLAMFLLFRELGGLDFGTLLDDSAALSQSTLNWAILLLFIGATGKSAQIPLFVWLPDAMAGPTPVSALIHAATMVTSGLYLLARLSPMVLAAPDIMMVIAIVAAITAIMAATIAITQNDIKKVLAYSTVSQLGYMFMAASVGAFFVAIFHVMTHAFFKACLFLGSGSVIHAMHHVEHELQEHGVVAGETGKVPVGEATQPPSQTYSPPFDAQDMRTMGGLAKYMPSTNITFLIATLAIAGIPPLAGFWSKDEILAKAFEYGYDGQTYAYFVFAVGLITAVLTGFYMMRAYVLTFLGKERWPMADRIHPHESPATITIPLWVLAVLSIFGGFLGVAPIVTHFFGIENWIHHYLGSPYGGPVAEPAIAPHGPEFLVIELVLIFTGALVAILSVLYALRVYTRHGLDFDARLRESIGKLYDLWEGKYYWDEFYQRYVVGPLIGFSKRGLAAFDSYVVDGAVNGVGYVTQGLGRGLRFIQTGVVHAYALAMVIGVVLILALMLLL
ncbi:MAG: NADH-quinone oxidoreductase subunit L [Bacteroidota bacterium]